MHMEERSMIDARSLRYGALLGVCLMGAAAAQERRTPAMRQLLYEHLSQAQSCVEAEDYPCAFGRLGAAGRLEQLNGYEQAQIWNFYAFLHFQRNDFAAAIAAYEQLLEQDEVPLGLERQSLYSLATLYMQQGEYASALGTIDRWFAMTDQPSAEPYVLYAQALYQTGEYAAGIERIGRAMALAESRGIEVQEGWYQLLCAMHLERDDWAAVADTLETMVRRWPENRDYFVQLAGVHGKLGNRARELDLYEGAYAAGWLDKEAELLSLARMLLEDERPTRALEVLRRGLEDGTLPPTDANFETLQRAEAAQRQGAMRL